MHDFEVDPEGNIRDVRRNSRVEANSNQYTTATAQAAAPIADGDAPHSPSFWREMMWHWQDSWRGLLGSVLVFVLVTLLIGKLGPKSEPRTEAERAFQRAIKRADETDAAKRSLEDLDRQLSQLEGEHENVVLWRKMNLSKNPIMDAAVARNQGERLRLSSEFARWEQTWSFHFQSDAKSDEWAKTLLAMAKKRLSKLDDNYRTLDREGLRKSHPIRYP
ncbi:MAG: hypothetical protein KGQ60_08565 [Planctomycetes bacterium]|nr:hypothetical protein [Planctomycetota bacterium]